VIKFENECVDCGLPCVFDNCPNYRVKHYYCDSCGSEDKLYEYDDQQLCFECLLEQLHVVE